MFKIILGIFFVIIIGTLVVSCAPVYTDPAPQAGVVFEPHSYWVQGAPCEFEIKRMPIAVGQTNSVNYIYVAVCVD